MASLDAGVLLRDVQLAARHADPRTSVYDRRRENFDRHAAYVVVASWPEGRPKRKSSRAHSMPGHFPPRVSGVGRPSSTTIPAAAMLEQEAIDRLVRRSFDLSIEVLLVPVLRRKRTEVVVIVREGVPDVGPRTEGRPLL